MSLSSMAANDISNYICRATAPTALTAPIMMSLHTADPGTTGANEASGGTYARQAVAYNAAVGGTCALGAALSFTVQAGTYTHYATWDSHATPKFLQGAPLAAPIVIGSDGQTITISADSLTATGTP